ncbi:MAG: hypothetical protein COY80_04870 [Candidatus Pacebacteria bacterium CG_4_10_14_0_8_um_filter_42_14]|nr:MAG: hypothetical protein COY80_04870 [Candidatus Pacebacteria bacterium CG_4_10_14_0_8_um_filter_42_14]
MADKIPLLVTGANGLVGSKFTELFSDKYSFDILELSDPLAPVDITDLEAVKHRFEASGAKACIHFAAFTNVTAAWEQRGDKSGLTYKVNVTGTENISQAAAQKNVHVIHLSTAYVFDGENKETYVESDKMNPIEWYGETKARAEDVFSAATHPWTILRIDQPFRSNPFSRLDIAHAFMAKIKANEARLFTNHYFGPTYIDDLARVIDFSISEKLTGLFHATAGEKWGDFELGTAIKNIFNLSGEIQPSDLDEYLKTVNRPYQRNTALNTDKLTNILPFKLKTVEEALAELIF